MEPNLSENANTPATRHPERSEGSNDNVDSPRPNKPSAYHPPTRRTRPAQRRTSCQSCREDDPPRLTSSSKARAESPAVSLGSFRIRYRI